MKSGQKRHPAKTRIEGRLLMLDDTTPHVAVVVQALRIDESQNQVSPSIVTILSDETGMYQFAHLPSGQYKIRCYTLDGYVYYNAGEILSIQLGTMLKHIDFRIPNFKKGTWKTYVAIDGLAYDAVLAIDQGRDGALWFATTGGGVSRFDGKHFVTFTQADGLLHNNAWTIGQDHDGNLWFGTDGGVTRYDGVEFTTFTREEGFCGSRNTPICCDSDGALWFGGGEGVFRYDGTQFVRLTEADGLVCNWVIAIHQSTDGALWFGTGEGVSRYDGSVFENFTTKDGLVHDCVRSICQASDGTLWFGTEGGVSHFVAIPIIRDGQEKKNDDLLSDSTSMQKFENITTKDGLIHNHVYAIHQDGHGTMWFGTLGGVSRYDGVGIVNYTEEDGLPFHEVTSIYESTDGALWFGTWGGGVSRFDEKGFSTLTTQDGLAYNHVVKLFRDADGLLWFGTYGAGLSYRDEKGSVSRLVAEELAHTRINAIYQTPDKAMWFGTDYGVFRYNGRTFQNLTTQDGLAADGVFSICGDPNSGVLWFGTVDGVSRYDEVPRVRDVEGKENSDETPSELTSVGQMEHITTEDGLAHPWVYAIHRESDGTLWFGTMDGLSRHDGKEWCNFTTKEGLVNSWVWGFYRDSDGALWLGTLGGVSRYDGKEFVNFTTKDGLAHNHVFVIYRAKDGALWFGTQGGGATRYDGGVWTSLDTRDGLAGNRVTDIYEDEDGSLLFATEGGVTRYRPNRTPPRIEIIAVTTDWRYTDLNRIFPAIAGTRVTFEYNSIDFKTHPDKRLYRCRIGESSKTRNVGLRKPDSEERILDAEFRYAGVEPRTIRDSEFRQKRNGASRVASSENLGFGPPTKETTFDWSPETPGSYTFEVVAIDRDGNDSEPAFVDVHVESDPKLRSLQAAVAHLRQEVGRKYHFDNIIGRSAPIKQMFALMEKAIDSGLTILLTGETGTGKELVARAIHYNSPRKAKELLDINCGAIPKELVASTLFGHRKGTFTGATEDKMGLFETATGSTVILDEIGEMPEESQIHLLRVLQESKVVRIGEFQSRDVDVRVIAITNRDLNQDVAEGRFRQDLYYRLNVLGIHLPPLRERLDDIPLLAEYFLEKAYRQQEKELDEFMPDVIEMLQNYPWPGNIRELENEIFRATALVEEGLRIHTYHFSPHITQRESLIQEVLTEQTGLSSAVEQLQRRMITSALRECGGNRTQAAKQLGMHRPSLVRLMRRLGIDGGAT